MKKQGALFVSLVLWIVLYGGLLMGQDHQNTTLIGRWTQGPCEAVAVSGDIVYFGNGESLEIANFSDPANPVILGQAITHNNTLDITINGDYAYVAAGDSGLRIIDVSDPVSPIETGYCDSIFASKVFLEDNYAYVVGRAGWGVIDVSNPTSPTVMEYFRTGVGLSGISVKDIALNDDYAYIIFQNSARCEGCWSGLWVKDISEPTNPIDVGTFSGIWPYAIVLSDDYIYVASYDGLMILAVSDPTNPELIGFFDTRDTAYNVTVQGDYAYLATGDAGLRIIDVSDPANPVEVGYFDTEGDALDVTVSGNYAYVADGEDGLYIIRNDLAVGVESEVAELPTQFQLAQNYPNPFNPTTTIRYGLPQDSPVNLVIYDLTGREVWRYSQPMQPAGWHQVAWDGRSSSGELVSTGVYFYRLQAGDFVQVKKMVVLR